MTKKILLSLVFSCFTIVSFSQEIVKVNTDASSLIWTGSKLTSSHQGTINLKSGEIEIKDGKLVGGEFIIDMTSIKNTDIEDEEYRAKLDGHLKSKDFFNVEQFPLATITITKAVKGDGDFYKVVADLTIKGITHPVTFQANVAINELNFLARAKIKIDRTKWDIKYNSGSFFDGLGDYLILDEIEFDVFLLSEK